MTKQIYAGIGARETPDHILNIMHRYAACVASKYICNTGACKGADQAFATGALDGDGEVQLFIPWSTYEQYWIARHKFSNVTVYDPNIHIEATASVVKYHPAATNLSSAVTALHARNYLILNNVSWVVCWTAGGAIVGGTGQALRMCYDKDIPVWNLGNSDTFRKVVTKLQELGY